MNAQSMPGYFEHVRTKTYIDNYPEHTVRLDELRNATIIELGCGVGNDALFLLGQVGVDPSRLFLVESDPLIFTEALDNLESGGWSPYDLGGVFMEGVFELTLPDGIAEVVYANNFLHCLGYHTTVEEAEVMAFQISARLGRRIQPEWEGAAKRTPEQRIESAVRKAWNLLRQDGIFFGRTLSDRLDHAEIQILEGKTTLSERERFALKTAQALQTGELVGIQPEELEQYGKRAGFKKTLIQIRPTREKPTQDYYFRFEK